MSDRSQSSGMLERLTDHQAVRPPRLFVVRESAVSNRMLMQGMVQQTLEPHRGAPGVSEALDLGLRVLDEDEPVANRVVIRHEGTKLVVFWREDTYFVFSMASAASTIGGDSADNAFVVVLADLLELLQPSMLLAATFSRLIRAAEFSGRLLSATQRFVEEVVLGETRFDPVSEAGRIQWQTLSMVSDMERRAIVQRLTVGALHACSQQLWLPGEFGYPPGYHVRDKRLEINDEEVEATREMLHLLADGSIPAWQLCERIGALGLSTPKLRKLAEKRAELEGADPGSVTMAAARNPSAIVRTLRNWVELYETGRHRRVILNPFPRISQLAGYRVTHGLKPESEHPHGSFEFVYQPGVPERGWVSREVTERIRDLLHKPEGRSRPTARGGRTHRTLMPLLALPTWTDRDYEYRLASEHDRYLLLRRPSRLADEPWTDPRHRYNDQVQRLALIEACDLHQSLAKGVAAAIRDGLPAERVAGLSAAVTREGLVAYRSSLTNRRIRLTQELDDLERRSTNARRNANDASDETSRREFLTDHERLRSELDRKRRQLHQIDEEANTEPAPLNDTFDVEGAYLARALANLARAGVRTSADIGTALQTVLDDFTVEADAYQVVWTCHVLVPSTDGVVRLGPASGSVNNVAVVNRSLHADRNREFVERFLRDGCSLDELAALRRIGRDHARTLLFDGLHELGLDETASSALASCPIPEPRRAVWAALTEETNHTLDEHYVRHLTQTYCGEMTHWHGNRWIYPPGKRQRILDALTDLGGRASPEQVAERAGVSRQYVLTVARPRQRKAPGDVSTYPPILTTVTEGDQPKARILEVALIPCPHCSGDANVIVRVPEIPTAVLCPRCRHFPHRNSPPLPPSYLELQP